MDDLIKKIENSNSNDIVNFISKNMYGNTFYHHYHILYDIRTLLGEDKKIYTEIGTFHGGSMSLMLSHYYETEINCIDPLCVSENQLNYVNENIKKFNKNNYTVNFYRGYSTDINLLKNLKDKNFKTDILFIDGDHSYDVVINDFNNFKEFVNPNGYIVFDDYFDKEYSPDVKYAVDDIVKNIDTSKYEVLGTMKNIKNSYMEYAKQDLNEFIIMKK